jgi:hypothetical protein
MTQKIVAFPSCSEEFSLQSRMWRKRVSPCVDISSFSLPKIVLLAIQQSEKKAFAKLGDELVAHAVSEAKDNRRNFFSWHFRRWLALHLQNYIHATEAEKADLKHAAMIAYIDRFPIFALINLNQGYVETDDVYTIHTEVSSLLLHQGSL